MPSRARSSKAAEPHPDVIHIEDDDEWADLVERWLAARALKVRRLRSRAEAAEFLPRCAQPPRCFLLDIGLPDATGLDLCDQLKLLPGTQGVPIVVLTGSGTAPVECLSHDALYCVPKDAQAEQTLGAVIHSILSQQDRSLGILDAGDLRLDPRDRSVTHQGRLLTTLDTGPFAALAALLRSQPRPISEGALYALFIERSYHTLDHELAVRNCLRTYVSRLRGKLGHYIGSRLAYVKDAGYAYIAPTPPPAL